MSNKKPYTKTSTNVRSASLINGLIKLGMGVVEMVAPSFAANLGAKLFTTTRRYRRNSQERALLKEAKAFKIDWKRKQLAAWSWGNGDTVLLVHGWEGRGSQLGSFVKPLVNAGYRVVAFDGPGHGDSSGNSSSVVALAESICAVSEQVGKIDTLIAHSVGSAASTLALSKGLKVGKAIYIAPPVGMLKYVQKFAQTVGLSLETADKIFNILCQKFNVDSSSLYLPDMARKMNTP
ncbi:MAG: alpha/beta hydrolase, partial [Blastocatellia bacterium]|nr:alpha/beta hydrolase [Blastocatellia bacterium]